MRPPAARSSKDADGNPHKGDQITLEVRFLAPIDPNNPTYQTQVSQADPSRPPEACEPSDFAYDEATYGKLGKSTTKPLVQGDPTSKEVVVSCLVKDDGEFDLKQSDLQEALDYVNQNGGAGGVVFYFGRGSEAEVDLHDVKDQYDQRHVISPVKLTSRSLKIGRFEWTGDTP
jgi:hypothetical protein